MTNGWNESPADEDRQDAPPPSSEAPPGSWGYGSPPPPRSGGSGGYGNAPPPPVGYGDYGYGSTPPYTPRQGSASGGGYGSYGFGETTPPWVAQTGGYASYWARAGGYILDAIIVAIISVVVQLPLHGWHTAYTNTAGTRVGHLQFDMAALVLQAAIVTVYATVFLGARRGQTPGMMAARIRLVSADSGGPVGYGRALARAVLAYVLGIVLFFPLVIDLLWPIWDKRNQTLHDKAVRSVVIKV